MRRYARFFAAVGELCTSAGELTSIALLNTFGTEGLRRHKVPFSWMAARYANARVDLEQSVAHSGMSTRSRLLARVESGWQQEILRRYLAFLMRCQQRWREHGWVGDHERFTDRTVTLLLRAAKRFLETLDDDVTSVHAIDRLALERFVTKLPGQRNALHSFIQYLNRRERLFQKLELVSPPKGALPYHHLLTEPRARALIQRWLHDESVHPRNALMCLFMLLYARKAVQVCRLRRKVFRVHEDGRVFARFGPVSTPLPEPLARMLLDYLAAIEEARGEFLAPDDYLFPGQLPGRPFTPEGLRYILNQEGVSAHELFTTAMASLFRGRLTHPKVIARALGISIPTVIRYWEAFSPRVSDEMTQLT
ncbi:MULTISPECIES: hypothetical protein [unclassified Variovorax]|uniref:hypothetical protein n=1 Tax=unclassified Variovorax TaxID=663243 RepID=UPI0013A55672|nr:MULTISPECIES: hypothetical protein [unclassified Variovorax]